MYHVRRKISPSLFLDIFIDLTGICRGINKEGRVLPPSRAAEKGQ